MEKICKIVYFDEESVTDYVQIVAGGELQNTTELLKSRDAQEAQSVQAGGKIGICRTEGYKLIKISLSKNLCVYNSGL